MKVEKGEESWIARSEEIDNKMGMKNLVRFLEQLNDEIDALGQEDLILKMDLEQLVRVNSQVIAQFVTLQSNLVRTNGRLRIVNANPELRGAFDVVMLDKIINIQYLGPEGEEGEEE